MAFNVFFGRSDFPFVVKCNSVDKHFFSTSCFVALTEFNSENSRPVKFIKVNFYEVYLPEQISKGTLGAAWQCQPKNLSPYLFLMVVAGANTCCHLVLATPDRHLVDASVY